MELRPLNTYKPYYEWEIEDGSADLVIYSECCADRFSGDQQYALYEILKAIYEGEQEKKD